VAQQTQGSHIREVALPSALRDRHNVIGVPKRFAAAFAKFPLFEKLSACGKIQLAHVTPQRDGIDAALRAYAVIAREYLVAKITGVGAQLPFVNAGLGTEGPASFGNFGPAPSAKRAARRTAFEF
jgi:hypothetical protein